MIRVTVRDRVMVSARVRVGHRTAIYAGIRITPVYKGFRVRVRARARIRIRVGPRWWA